MRVGDYALVRFAHNDEYVAVVRHLIEDPNGFFESESLGRKTMGAARDLRKEI